LSSTKPPSEISDFNENWNRWRDMVRQMPDVRTEKVVQVRKALQDQAYDSISVLEETIRRVAAEIDSAT